VSGNYFRSLHRTYSHRLGEYPAFPACRYSRGRGGMERGCACSHGDVA
jgi:hypothetical protein